MRALSIGLFVVMATLVTNNFASAQFGCGSPGTGDCCATNGNGTPYCDDMACCEMVCDIDPYCCNTEWDLNCATAANQQCSCGTGGPECGDENAGDCCIPNGTPTCNDLKCCSIVCAIDYFCCTHEWDQFCAESALMECNDCGSGEEFGACCLTGGDCEWTTLSSCTAMGGVFSAGIDCAIADCGPTGACCLPTGCQEGMTSNACLLAGGVWAGEATTCEDVKCILEVGPDSQFQTIQAAVDAATNGDTIHVYPGTYTQLGDDQVVMIEKSLAIEGVGDGDVIIDGVHESRGFVVVVTKSSGETNTYLTIRNVLFKNCKAVGIDLDLSGVIDTWEKSGGGALIRGADTIHIQDCDISDCEAPDGDGGAIAGYADVDGPMAGFHFKVEITDSILKRNQAMNGGAIKFEGPSEFKLNNSSLENNRASEDGGAIDLDCPWYVPGINEIKIEFGDDVFKENEADDDGGALDLDRIGICGPDSPGDDDGGKFNGPDCEDGLVPVEAEFKDLLFEDNRADADEDGEGDGGAVRFRNINGVTCDTCEFNRNIAGEGGAIDARITQDQIPALALMHVLMEYCTAVDNSATHQGGVVNVENATSLTFIEFVMEYNQAGASGGCFHGVSVEEVYVAYCTWRNNKAGIDGGAMNVNGNGEGEVEIDHSVIEYNEAGVGENAEGNGGGVHIESVKKADIHDSTIKGNEAGVGPGARGKGGGLSVKDVIEELKITLNSVLENQAGVGENAEGHGGGIHIEKSEEEAVQHAVRIISELNAQNNRAGVGEGAQGTGGGVELEGPDNGGGLVGEDSTEFVTCLISGNIAGSGGGIRVGSTATTPQLTDTTVCENAVGQIEGAFTNGGGNTIGEECPADCPADFNSDGFVDGGDLGAMLAAWGPCPGCPEDLTGDGHVDGGDLGLLLAAFGPCS